MEPTQPTSPIFKEENSWYFWDETWANAHGPFNSKREAEFYLDCYWLVELEGPSKEAREYFLSYRKDKEHECTDWDDLERRIQFLSKIEKRCEKDRRLKAVWDKQLMSDGGYSSEK